MPSLALTYLLNSTEGKAAVSRYLRKSPEDRDLQILERLLLSETIQGPLSRFVLDQVGSGRALVSAPIAVDNRYKAGTASMALGSGAETITLTGKNVDNLAHAVVVADPGAAGASLSTSVAVGSTGVRTITVSLATSQHALSVAIGPAAETIVVTGRDGKAHTVEIAAGGALSTSVVFDAAGVAAIVVTKNDGVSTVAEVLAELNSGTAGTLVSAALGTATGAEVAQTVGAAPLAGGGAITSTVTQVLAQLNSGDSGEVLTAALGTANGAETCQAVGSTPLASMTATATATGIALFGYNPEATKAISGAALVRVATGADGSTLDIQNAAAADAQVINQITIDQADQGSAVTGAASATGALAAGALLKATLTAAAGANVEANAQVLVQQTGAGSYSVKALSLDAGFKLLGFDIIVESCTGANGSTVAGLIGSTTAFSTVTVNTAHSGTTLAATLGSTVSFPSGGDLALTITVAAGASLRLAFVPKYALIGDSAITAG